MRVNIKKGEKEYTMFADFWQMTQNLWGIEDTEAYWDSVRTATEAFSEKHGEFGQRLAVALACELERRSVNELDRQGT